MFPLSRSQLTPAPAQEENPFRFGSPVLRFRDGRDGTSAQVFFSGLVGEVSDRDKCMMGLLSVCANMFVRYVLFFTDEPDRHTMKSMI